ncbi:uncharacterized protein LOC113352025 [Papaver somniferum]|uniref:uncharacterized protein LOC113352025 n=1 Tax=Papaver somniferum TaxID=3469 RepID=UPI000E6F9CFB|nr:uncharacterized protein LOC113352025 [Papaver somniferum]
MSFWSVPTSSDCVVIAISDWCEVSNENDIFVLVTETGKRATSWTVRQFYYEGCSDDDFMSCINNPIFYNGALYCLDYNGMLGVFKMKGNNSSWKVLSMSLKQFSGFFPSYLVQCDGKLLLVNLGQSGKLIEVYRLDDSEMVWVKLTSLGKHALFISYTSSFSVVAHAAAWRTISTSLYYKVKGFYTILLIHVVIIVLEVTNTLRKIFIIQKKDQTALGLSLDGLRQVLINLTS